MRRGYEGLADYIVVSRRSKNMLEAMGYRKVKGGIHGYPAWDYCHQAINTAKESDSGIAVAPENAESAIAECDAKIAALRLALNDAELHKADVVANLFAQGKPVTIDELEAMIVGKEQS